MFSLLNVTNFMEPKYGTSRRRPLKIFKHHVNDVLGGLLNLSYETQRRYLPSLVGTISAKHQIYTRYVKLVSKMENSESASFLARRCRNLPRSIIGRNLKIIWSVIDVEMSIVKNGAGGLLWNAHVSQH